MQYCFAVTLLENLFIVFAIWYWYDIFFWHTAHSYLSFKKDSGFGPHLHRFFHLGRPKIVIYSRHKALLCSIACIRLDCEASHDLCCLNPNPSLSLVVTRERIIRAPVWLHTDLSSLEIRHEPDRQPQLRQPSARCRLNEYQHCVFWMWSNFAWSLAGSMVH